MQEPNTYIRVSVTEIYDPSKFWFNLHEYECQLKDLMYNLQYVFMFFYILLMLTFYIYIPIYLFFKYKPVFVGFQDEFT